MMHVSRRVENNYFSLWALKEARPRRHEWGPIWEFPRQRHKGRGSPDLEFTGIGAGREE